MNIFKDTCFTWWQMGIFKWGVFGCGLLVGAYFNEWIAAYVLPIAVITVIFIIYITIVWIRQNNS